MGDIGSGDPHRAGQRRPQPGERLHQFGLAVALHAGHAENLAGPHLQREAPHGQLVAVVHHLQAVHGQHRLAGPGRRLFHAQRHRAPHHHGGQAALVGLGWGHGAHHLPLAQYHDAVGQGQHLFELVGNKDHRFAPGHQCPDDDEQIVDFLGGQHRRGLIQDQHVGIAIEHLDDLDALLHAHGQCGYHSVRIDLQAVLLRDGGDPRRGLPAIEKDAAANTLGAQHDVLRHRKGRHQHKVLVHHADALGNGVGGPLNRRLLAAHHDLAPIGRVQTIEDVHKGRLAGAVFTQQRQDLTAVEGEIDVIVGHNSGEHLGDAAQFQNGGCHGPVPPTRR